MPTAKGAVTINLLDATSAMPVEVYGEVIVIGSHTTNLNYNVVKSYTTQAAVETEWGAGSAIAKATAKVFAQGVPSVKVLNVYKDAVAPNDYSTCLAALETNQVKYNIMVPLVQVDDVNFGVLVTHATTYKKVLICPIVNSTAANTNTKMNLLTKDETQYAITHDTATYVVQELAGAVAGLIAKLKPWIPPEWMGISGINASGYSPDDINTLETNRVNAVIAVGTATVLSSGMALKAGTWIDVQRTKQYLSDLIRNELINLKLNLANRNQKIPYTPKGLGMVESTIRKACKLAQTQGALREDTIKSDETPDPGYTVSMPLFENISGSDKSARLLQGITVTTYLSGAMSKITLDLVITL